MTLPPFQVGAGQFEDVFTLPVGTSSVHIDVDADGDVDLRSYLLSGHPFSFFFRR